MLVMRFESQKSARRKGSSALVKKYERYRMRSGMKPGWKHHHRQSIFPNVSPLQTTKKKEDPSSTQKCYECNQAGHVRLDCPIYKRKMEKSNKTSFKEKKGNKAYISWEENDIELESDSENEVVNLDSWL